MAGETLTFNATFTSYLRLHLAGGPKDIPEPVRAEVLNDFDALLAFLNPVSPHRPSLMAAMKAMTEGGNTQQGERKPDADTGGS